MSEVLRVSLVWEELEQTYLRASVGSVSLVVPGKKSLRDQ